MFYSKDATETIVSPTDTVRSHPDQYDSWWQMCNCRTGKGDLRFYKSNGITRCNVDIHMRNKLWYISQDVASTIYHAKINESSDAFVRTITGSTLHNLWHHRLCHAGKFATDNIAKIADGISSLRSHKLFFSCNDCTPGKFTNMIKGYNKNPDRATKQGERFNLDYGFCTR